MKVIKTETGNLTAQKYKKIKENFECKIFPVCNSFFQPCAVTFSLRLYGLYRYTEFKRKKRSGVILLGAVIYTVMLLHLCKQHFLYDAPLSILNQLSTRPEGMKSADKAGASA